MPTFGVVLFVIPYMIYYIVYDIVYDIVYEIFPPVESDGSSPSHDGRHQRIAKSKLTWDRVVCC